MHNKARHNRPLRGLDLRTACSGLCWRRYVSGKLMKLIVALVLLFSVNAFAKEFTQGSSNMEPTLMAGEKFQVSVLGIFNYQPQRWDVVMYKPPYEGYTGYYVGRIVGMPSEVLEIKHNTLLVDGAVFDMPQTLKSKGIKYVPAFEVTKKQEHKNAIYTIEDGSYFILGDNTLHSNDSRFFGTVGRDLIVNEIDVK